MKITIIGAGISGLLSAYYLSKAGHEITIFEKSERPGGLIQTFDSSFGPMDFAASSLVNSAAFEELFNDIALEYAAKSPLAAIKTIYRNGMKRWPLGPLESLRLLFGAGRILLSKNKGLSQGQTIKDWGGAFFRKSRLQIFVGNIFTRGICGRLFPNECAFGFGANVCKEI